MKFVFLFILTASFTLAIRAQTPEQSAGTILYQQGKYSEAAKALNTAVKSKAGKNDPNLWNRLGLTETALGDFKKAVKAFKKATEFSKTDSVIWSNLGYAQLRLRDLNAAQSATDRAVQIDPNNVFAYYVRGLAHLWEGDLDKAQKNYREMVDRDKKYSKGYILGAWIQLARLNKVLSAKEGELGKVRDHVDMLKTALEIVSSGLENCGNCDGKRDLEIEHESLSFFYSHYTKEPVPVVPGVPKEPEPGVTPFRITSKRPANYTTAARQAGVQGTVRLAVLLRPDGNVGHIFVLKRLGYGLDENAIAAARNIKFKPKMKDGKPIPTVVTLEYGFNIY